ncbi:hypothetical protein QWJ34_16370 [Saccharibacillus sp. CPCC 101409]|uniref:hypothetical protein n=1 Tax=Saccharibacillus sp. CPCC 101409 TaxID=3058041 RepID=UPI0026722754|nr:hypothetical protein [Saccharibacillus sp. CPCC 101409]MDO3411342.1 hypothetical protein [Saccharibacillus sp. CPCC 101409]
MDKRWEKYKPNLERWKSIFDRLFVFSFKSLSFIHPKIRRAPEETFDNRSFPLTENDIPAERRFFRFPQTDIRPLNDLFFRSKDLLFFKGVSPGKGKRSLRSFSSSRRVFRFPPTQKPDRKKFKTFSPDLRNPAIMSG